MDLVYNNEETTTTTTKEKRDSTSSDLVLIESKDFAQVVFDDVRDEYTEASPLECVFSLNELLAASDTDWIGIYKVGFSSHRDFLCKVDIDVKALVNNNGKVTFPAEKLPRDDGEFYQFVYVSQSKQMRGASVPFQFKKARLSDYVEVEEQEAIVYKSKESAINDTLSEIRSRCIHLTQANETYERLIKENEELIACLKAEMSALKTRCLHLTLENEKINNTLRSKVESFTNLTDKIASLTEENTRLQEKFENISGENRNLLDSLQTRIDQVAQLKAELESVKLNKDHFENILYVKEDELVQLKKDKDELSQIADDLKRINDQIVKLERQVDERVEELTKIKLELKRNEAIVVEQAHTIHNILAERDNLYSVIEKLTKEKMALECSQENLSQELNMSKDKLLAAEQCKELLRAQLVALTEELNEAVTKVTEQACTIDEMRTRQTSANSHRDELVEKLRSENSRLESELEQSNGAYHALKLAHAHLESRLKTTEANRVRHDKEHHSALEKMREENEELRERIKAGAKEYSKLFDKYRLIRNQQLNMDVYHDLNGDVVLSTRRSSPNIINYTSTNNSSGNAAATNILFDRFFNSSMLTDSQFDSDSAIQVIEHFFAKINKETTTTTKSAATSATNVQSQNENENENKLWEELIAASVAARQQQKLQQQKQIELEEEAKQQTTAIKSSSSSPNSFQSVATSTTGSPTMVPTTATTLSRSKLNVSVDDGLLTKASAKSSSLTASGEEKPSSMDEKKDDLVLNKEQKNNVLRMELKTRSSVINEPSGNCDICDYIFPSNSTVEDIEKHYQHHYGPSCPVCFMTFRKGYPQPDFETHVQSHFVGSD